MWWPMPMAARMTGFGPDYIIPKPFDPRLILHIAPAVARAAMESGVARRPIADFDAYERELEKFVYRSGQLMRPVFDVARQNPRRVVYAEGEEDRVLRAVQTVVDEGLAHPTLIGRRDGDPGKDQAAGPAAGFQQGGPHPGSPGGPGILRAPDRALSAPGGAARACSRTRPRAGSPPATASPPPCCWMRAKSMPRLCGGLGDWTRQLTNILPIIPRQPGVSRLYSLSALILPNGALFFCDTHVNVDPTAEQIAEMTLLAAKTVRRFGLAPKAALLSHSSFGTSHRPSALKMRKALSLLRAAKPDFEFDGEMHADAALSESLRGPHRLQQPPYRFGQSAGDADSGRRQYRAHAVVRRHRSLAGGAACCWASPSRCM